MAADHPELAKADRALAAERIAQQTVLDKTALRQQSIKKAEEAKLVAEILSLHIQADARARADQNNADPPGISADPDAEIDPNKPLKARVPIDARSKAFEDGKAAQDGSYGAPADSAESQRAEVFKREHDPVAGTHLHPELAGAYAVVAAIDRKAVVDGLSNQARQVVNRRVRENIYENLRRDITPSIALRDDPQNEANQPPERLVER